MSTKPEYKWVIGQENRIGPCEELVVKVPRAFPDDDDYYFVRGPENQIVHQSRVFNDARSAGLAEIAANEQKIRNLENTNQRIGKWLRDLEVSA